MRSAGRWARFVQRRRQRALMAGGNVSPLTGKQPTNRSWTPSNRSSPSSRWVRANGGALTQTNSCASGPAHLRQMRHDDQVKAATTFKRDAVVSRGWTLGYEENSTLTPEEQARRVDVLMDIIEAYPAPSRMPSTGGPRAGLRILSDREKCSAPWTWTMAPTSGSPSFSIATRAPSSSSRTATARWLNFANARAGS